jgi:hypothetical protein
VADPVDLDSYLTTMSRDKLIGQRIPLRANQRVDGIAVEAKSWAQQLPGAKVPAEYDDSLALSQTPCTVLKALNLKDPTQVLAGQSGKTAKLHQAAAQVPVTSGANFGQLFMGPAFGESAVEVLHGHSPANADY